MATDSMKKNVMEPVAFLAVFILLFGSVGHKMGFINMLNTLMRTAYDLLISTVFYIMAIAVLAGAIGAVLSEFGVIGLINKLLAPLMRPLYGLPGAASVGIMTTYLSDNPAILALAEDRSFIRYFRKYQVPALTNIGTAFGMGAVITTFVIGLSPSGSGELIKAALIGNLGAVIGSIISTRLMLHFTKREFGTEEWAVNAPQEEMAGTGAAAEKHRSIGMKVIESTLAGGKAGVKIGLEIIPGS